MNRNIEITVPMFIGIILLIAITTSGLVYLFNNMIRVTDENNKKYYSTSSQLENWLIECNEMD